MATITKGKTFISGETVEPADLHNLVDLGTISNIVDADISASAAIAGSKLAAGAIGTTQLAADAVTADKLDGVADIDTKTADYTLVLADAGRVIEFNSASNLTLTVPTNATVAFATGTTIVVTRRGTGDVTVAGPGVDLRSGGSKLKIGQQYAGIALIKIGTDEWMVLGDLKS
jgi:hypothetical protein